MGKELDRIIKACHELRNVLASSDTDTDEGVCKLLRECRLQLDAIDSAVYAMITSSKQKGPAKPATAYPVHTVGEVVTYHGIICTVEAVGTVRDGEQASYMYDLREKYGDGEYLDVPERYVSHGAQGAGNRKPNHRVAGLKRFYMISDCHGNDIWLNVFRIAYICGKELVMTTGERFQLTPDEADDLKELVGMDPQQEFR